MIHLYVAETSEGFDSLRSLSDRDLIFPEVFNGKPRTELELRNYLSVIFDNKNLSGLKDKTTVVYTTSVNVLNFFRVLIIDDKLFENDFLCIFITKGLKRIEIRSNNDGRLNLWPDGFFVQLDRDLDRLLEGKLK